MLTEKDWQQMDREDYERVIRKAVTTGKVGHSHRYELTDLGKMTTEELKQLAENIQTDFNPAEKDVLPEFPNAKRYEQK